MFPQTANVNRCSVCWGGCGAGGGALHCRRAAKLVSYPASTNPSKLVSHLSGLCRLRQTIRSGFVIFLVTKQQAADGVRKSTNEDEKPRRGLVVAAVNQFASGCSATPLLLHQPPAGRADNICDIRPQLQNLQSRENGCKPVTEEQPC